MYKRVHPAVLAFLASLVVVIATIWIFTPPKAAFRAEIEATQKLNEATKGGPKAEQNPKTPSNIPSETKTQPVVDSSVNTVSRPPKDNDEASEYWPFDILGAHLKITDSLLSLFTFLLIVVGIGQGIYLAKTDKATRLVAEAAKRSAENLPTLERAYLFIKSQAPEYTMTGVHIDYSFFNYGKTPAVIKSVEAHLALLSDPPDNSEHVPTLIPTDDAVVQNYAAWEVRPRVSLDRSIDDEVTKAMGREEVFLWFYGSVVYDDVFGNERITRFRWRYVNVLGGPYGGKPYNERT